MNDSRWSRLPAIATQRNSSGSVSLPVVVLQNFSGIFQSTDIPNCRNFPEIRNGHAWVWAGDSGASVEQGARPENPDPPVSTGPPPTVTSDAARPTTRYVTCRVQTVSNTTPLETSDRGQGQFSGHKLPRESDRVCTGRILSPSTNSLFADPE